MSSLFDEVYADWLRKQMAEELNPRRREILRKGPTYGTETFLRTIWYPAVGNFEHLYPEYEVRDLNNKYRYLDLAYMPGGLKGCIEIQDYRTHARDIDVERFKDLCMKQAVLSLDDWCFLPVAFLSIRDDPGLCKQMALSFVGKFLSMDVGSGLSWAETETLRYARRVLRPFEPRELTAHLQLSDSHTRAILRSLVEKKRLIVASGQQRYRTYQLNVERRGNEVV